MKGSFLLKGKSIRCKYFYRLGHHDSQCKQKEAKRPPSMPDRVSRAVCRKCKKKGHLSFKCHQNMKTNLTRLKIQKEADILLYFTF